MTANQINYARHLEDKRHNKVMEDQGQQVIRETGRHNLVTEDIAWYNAYEQGRHNKATESIGWFTAKEQKRHNLASEDIGRQNVALGWAQVEVSKRANTINEVNAITRAQEADTHRWQVEKQAQETKRHNVQTEINQKQNTILGYNQLQANIKNNAIRNSIYWVDTWVPNNFITGISGSFSKIQDWRGI